MLLTARNYLQNAIRNFGDVLALLEQQLSHRYFSKAAGALSLYLVVGIVVIVFWPLFSSFALSAVYSSLDVAAGYVTSLRVSLRCIYGPLFGSYKQLRQPRRAFAGLFPVCIIIYQAGIHGHVQGMK